MPETIRKTKPAKVAAAEPAKPTVTQQDVDEVLFPELSRDEFAIGGRAFKIRVLPYKFEQMFRRQAMPILEAELKPIEMAAFKFTTNERLIQPDLKITESIMKSEIDSDVYLVNAVVVMCMSQDERILSAASKGQELPADKWQQIEKEYRMMIEYNSEWQEHSSPRHYLREIVRRQQDKMKMVERLGESLMARFADASSLVGAREQFESLKRDFMPLALKFLEKAGNRAGVAASLFLPSTETGSATNRTAKQSSAPKKVEAKTPEVAAPPAEEQGERVQ